MPTWVFHMTDIDNLPSILSAGGLTALNQLRQQQQAYTSIAYDTLQDRRATKVVPCGPGGVLHDYVPFYFAPRSPMLYAIHMGRVPTYLRGQRTIVHLATTVEAIQQAGLRFVLTDGHAIMNLSQFFDDVSQLPKIDWKVRKSTYWNDTASDPDRSRRRQAEFLAHETVPWALIQGIGVRDEQIRDQVVKLLTDAGQQTVVKTKANWCY